MRVFVPSDTTALSVGADAVAQRIRDLARQRNVPLELVRNGTRGLYWLEPLVEVELEDGKRIAYGPVTPEEVEALFDADFLSGARHALRVGVPEEVPYLARQQRLTFARIGLIDPLSLAAYRATGGYGGLERALAMSPGDIVAAVETSGLRGRGGAAFPTGIKWRTVLKTEAAQKYVVGDADGGDSGTCADRGYVYVRAEYPLAIRVLGAAIVKAEQAGWLGEHIQGTDRSFHLEVRVAAGAYICGEETSLLESLEGKRGMVRYRPPLPAVKGLFGQPTALNNLITLASVPVILARGAEYYRDFGTGRSRGTLTLQLAGNVKRGGLVEVPFGMSLREALEEFGGGTATGRPIRAVQVGGPLGAYVKPSQFDTPLDYEAFAGIGAMIGHGGVVVFDDSVDMGEQARFAMEFCAIESCGKCTPCRIGAVRGVEVIDRIRAGENVAGNLVLLRELCDTMVGGSLCALGGMAPFPVLSVLNHFPEDLGGGAKLAAGT